jgi:hypothetical protein
MMADTKFGMGNIVRFIGTDQHLAVKQCRTGPRQYQVQRDNDETTLEWVPEIYLELVKPASAKAAG